MENITNFFENNSPFWHLKSYYAHSDSAERYGVSRMEIKHSNFISWLLKPENNGSLGTMTIRNFIKLIQSKSTESTKFSTLDLDTAEISNVDIKRESVHHIDLFITLDIDKESYAFIIENKIYAPIADGQLSRYKTEVLNDNVYSNDNLVCAFLYTNYQDEPYVNEQVRLAKHDNYIPITYQNFYDEVLLPIVSMSTDIGFSFDVTDYIHCLATHNIDNENGINGNMIITKQERKWLFELFQSEIMVTLLDKISNSTESNEYTKFYSDNKSFLLTCLTKYLNLLCENKDKNAKMIIKIESIIYNRKYIMNGKSYRGITTLLKEMLNILISNGYTYNDLDSKLNSLYSDPLFVPVDKVNEVNHPKWFTTNNRKITIGESQYYILSAWYSHEYEELKQKINELNMGIILE